MTSGDQATLWWKHKWDACRRKAWHLLQGMLPDCWAVGRPCQRTFLSTSGRHELQSWTHAYVQMYTAIKCMLYKRLKYYVKTNRKFYWGQFGIIILFCLKVLFVLLEIVFHQNTKMISLLPGGHSQHPERPSAEQFNCLMFNIRDELRSSVFCHKL